MSSQVMLFELSAAVALVLDVLCRALDIETKDLLPAGLPLKEANRSPFFTRSLPDGRIAVRVEMVFSLARGLKILALVNEVLGDASERSLLIRAPQRQSPSS